MSFDLGKIQDSFVSAFELSKLQLKSHVFKLSRYVILRRAPECFHA